VGPGNTLNPWRCHQTRWLFIARFGRIIATKVGALAGADLIEQGNAITAQAAQSISFRWPYHWPNYIETEEGRD
jgi:hypothetical protein